MTKKINFKSMKSILSALQTIQRKEALNRTSMIDYYNHKEKSVTISVFPKNSDNCSSFDFCTLYSEEDNKSHYDDLVRFIKEN